MQIYLAAAPEHLAEARRFTERIAHAAYRIGPDGRLVRQNLLPRIRGGLLALGDWECGPVRDPAMLCREVWRECGNRNYCGVAADFEQPPSPDRVSFLEALGRVLARNRKQLFVPEEYGRRVASAQVLVCTALSGGSLRQRLEEAGQAFGQKRLALDLQRLRMSFPLPCPSGEGKALSGEELEEMMAQRQPSVFYSGDLCAKYFTSTQEGESRFVLFDDAGTLRRKMQLGRELGVTTGLLMYPEVEDILPELFGRR